MHSILEHHMHVAIREMVSRWYLLPMEVGLILLVKDKAECGTFPYARTKMDRSDPGQLVGGLQQGLGGLEVVLDNFVIYLLSIITFSCCWIRVLPVLVRRVQSKIAN